MDVEIEEATRELTVWAEQSALCRRAATVPGIGPIMATAVVAAVGDGRMFAAGRNMAAWLGLVPREYTTGGKPALGGISKRGATRLRQLFIRGAQALYVHMKRDHLGAWLRQVERHTSMIHVTRRLIHRREHLGLVMRVRPIT